MEIWEDVKRSHEIDGLRNLVPLCEAVVEGKREVVEKLVRKEREGVSVEGESQEK